MIRIRLRRMGAKRKAFYRIVVADGRSPRDGRFIETIGTYDPADDTIGYTLKEERAAHWLSVGAQPSDSVARLLRKSNLLDDNNKPIPFTAEAEAAESEAAPVATEVAAPVADNEAAPVATEAAAA